jgi:hypothetical protein
MPETLTCNGRFLWGESIIGCVTKVVAHSHNAFSDISVHSRWVRYPEACFGLVGREVEGWKVATFIEVTMNRC